MPVIAITEEYKFPSRSRKELYGDDQLVHIMWQGNPFFCAAATFRAPSAMPWGEFIAGIVEPWAAGDPDFTPGSAGGWTLDGQPFTPSEKTLDELGIGHKSLLTFSTDGSSSLTTG